MEDKEKKKEFAIIAKDVLIKMLEGAEKETDILNAFCMQSDLARVPLFGTELRVFIESLKDARKVEGEAVKAFLRFGKIDYVVKEDGKTKLYRINN